MRSTLIRLIVLLVVVGVVAGGYYAVKHMPEKKLDVPMIQVKRGDLMVRTYVRGELRSVRNTLVYTPNLGTTTQVTQLASAGSLAKAKDLIVEFDDSELLASLEDAQLEVTQWEQNILRGETDMKIRRNQDQVDLLRAQYAVRRSELDVKQNELISKIDARKNELSLEQAKHALSELQVAVNQRLQQGEAEIAVMREQFNRANLQLTRVKRRMEQTRVLAPMTGLVAIKENRTGGFFFGQQLPDIREGDQLNPGTPVAELLDLSELEVSARVNEVERASLREGQEVLVQLDALPGKIVHGKIKSLSGTASSNVLSSDPTKKFDCTFSIDMREMLAAVGATKQQIDHVMATAAENAKRFVAGNLGSPGQAQAMPDPNDESGDSGSDDAAAPAGGRRRGGAFAGRGGAGGRGRGGEAGAAGRGEGGRGGARGGAEQAAAGGAREGGGRRGGGLGFSAPAPELPGADAPAGRGGRGGARGGAGMAGMDVLELSMSQGGQQFSMQEREKAKLPPPAEDDPDMDVLLRPGLLVEAEIIVERIPGALYIPQQAVFEKNGRNVVFVRAGNKFEPRTIKTGKRTESQVAVVEGLREGEMVALSDMEAGPQSGKKEKGQGKTKPDQPALPGAGPKASLDLPGRVQGGRP